VTQTLIVGLVIGGGAVIGTLVCYLVMQAIWTANAIADMRRSAAVSSELILKRIDSAERQIAEIAVNGRQLQEALEHTIRDLGSRIALEIQEQGDPYRVLPKIWYDTSSNPISLVYAQRGLRNATELQEQLDPYQGFGTISRAINGSWEWATQLHHRSGQIDTKHGIEPSRDTAMISVEKQLAASLEFRQSVDYVKRD